MSAFAWGCMAGAWICVALVGWAIVVGGNRRQSDE